MKTIITLTFLLFSCLGFSQTTREEVVERNKYGQKLVVNTYTGTGDSEKLIKRTIYGESGIDNFHTSITPIEILYFGSFKYEFGKRNGDSIRVELTELRWGVVKREKYNREGKLLYKRMITDDNDIDGDYTTKYTIIP